MSRGPAIWRGRGGIGGSWIGAASFVIVAAMLVSCDGSALSYDQLKQVPESHLYYPGAMVLHMQGMGQSSGSLGNPPLPGTVRSDVQSLASPSTIIAWYMQQLSASRGWTYAGRQELDLAQPEEAYAWDRGDYPHAAPGSEQLLVQFEPEKPQGGDPFAGPHVYFLLYIQRCCGGPGS